jgi:hypothetical protein
MRTCDVPRFVCTSHTYISQASEQPCRCLVRVQTYVQSKPLGDHREFGRIVDMCTHDTTVVIHVCPCSYFLGESRPCGPCPCVILTYRGWILLCCEVGMDSWKDPAHCTAFADRWPLHYVLQASLTRMRCSFARLQLQLACTYPLLFLCVTRRSTIDA